MRTISYKHMTQHLLLIAFGSLPITRLRQSLQRSDNHDSLWTSTVFRFLSPLTLENMTPMSGGAGDQHNHHINTLTLLDYDSICRDLTYSAHPPYGSLPPAITHCSASRTLTDLTLDESHWALLVACHDRRDPAPPSLRREVAMAAGTLGALEWPRGIVDGADLDIGRAKPAKSNVMRNIRLASIVSDRARLAIIASA